MSEVSAQVKDALCRAFFDGGADFLRIDGWCPQWQMDGVAAAEAAGWLTGTRHIIEWGQQTEDRYRLTAAGRIALQAHREATYRPQEGPSP